MDCRFFQSAKGCFRGDSCTFRHDNNAHAPANGSNGADDRYAPYNAMNRYANGGAMDAPGSLVTPCRFYLTDMGCRNGEACTFAHLDAEPSPLGPSGQLYGGPEDPGMLMMDYSAAEAPYYAVDVDGNPVPAPVIGNGVPPVYAPAPTQAAPAPRRLQIQPNPSKKNFEVISEITPVLTRDIEGPFFAIDVECVATGHGNEDRDVARIAVVDEEEQVIFDQYVKPEKEIVSYLTQLTGITESDLVNAPTLSEALVDLRRLLPSDSVIVGQSIKKDMEWLGFEKGTEFKQMFDVADLFRIPMQMSNGVIRYRFFSLRHVAKYLLGHDIQEADHDPVIDAKYAMKIFKQFRHLHETPGHRDAVYQTLLKTPRTPSFAERYPVIDGVAMRAPRKPNSSPPGRHRGARNKASPPHNR